jgi:hypothetical protein
MFCKRKLFITFSAYLSIFALILLPSFSQFNFAQNPIDSKLAHLSPIQGNDNQSKLFGGPEAFDCIEKLLNDFRFNFDIDKLQQMLDKCMSQDFSNQTPEKPIPDQLKPKII